MSVVIDLAAGEARIAGEVLPGIADASSVVPGAVRLSDGTVLSPLEYGARAGVCSSCTDTASIAHAVFLAAGGSPECARAATEALALHLAGASETGVAPCFADVTFVMGRVFGWPVNELVAAPARVIDGLASSVLRGDDASQTDGDRTRADAGWTSYVLSDDASQTSDESVEQLRDRLADDLRRRAAAPLTEALEPGLHRTGLMSGVVARRFSPAEYPNGTAAAARDHDAEAWKESGSSLTSSPSGGAAALQTGGEASGTQVSPQRTRAHDRAANIQPSDDEVSETRVGDPVDSSARAVPRWGESEAIPRPGRARIQTDRRATRPTESPGPPVHASRQAPEWPDAAQGVFAGNPEAVTPATRPGRTDSVGQASAVALDEAVLPRLFGEPASSGSGLAERSLRETGERGEVAAASRDFPSPEPAAVDTIADGLAEALDDESDLRGLLR